MTKEDGLKIRQARRARVRLLRSRVIGAAVGLFMVVWSLIAVVLVTGHDPALAHKASTTATATTATAGGSAGSGSSSSSATTSPGSSTGSGSSGASSSTGSGSGSVSPLVTSQS